MNLALEYFFIYNPTLLPENPKASEVELMDAKKIFFYPPLVDINKQRNLMGMGEGFVAFYNTFKSSGNESENRETQAMIFNQRVMLSKCLDNDNFIVLILKHELGDQNDNKFNAINRLSRLDTTLYKRILDRFCKVFRSIFEPVQYYLSSQEKLIEFTENILRFIESYFYLNQENENNKRTLDISAKLFGDIIIKRKINNSLTLPIVRTILEMNNDYSNFYDLMVFKSSYLLYTRLEDDIVKTLTSILFDFDVKTSRLIESKPKIRFSKFFENFYDFEFLDTIDKDEYVLSEMRNKKHFSFNLPVKNNDDVRYYKFYATFIIEKDLIFILLLKNKMVPQPLINKLKLISKNFNIPFNGDIPKTKNLYFGFFNILNQSMTNAIDLYCCNKMSRGEVLVFISNFFKKQDKAENKDIFCYYLTVGYQSAIMNIVNGRITWIYSTDIDKYDVIDEFHLLKEKIKTIVI